jgi:hypothetical protein
MLNRFTFEPAVCKGWAALVGCVDADGKLTHVQPVGSDPKKFAEDSTAPYGVGAFLLAGSEVYRMAVLEKLHAIPNGLILVDWIGPPPVWGVRVKVRNTANFCRGCETVELDFRDVVAAAIRIKGDVTTQGEFVKTERGKKLINDYSTNNFVVMNGLSAQILDSQAYASDLGQTPDKLLFQVDLAPGETRTFYILDASALAAVPPPIVKTFARYVPERHEDFAWESDRIAHRMFGKALETWQAEPLTSSGVDVWIKRTRNLIINEMYRTGVYFDTNGVSQDDYRVSKSRGDGGLGIWEGQQLHVSGNWRNYRIITTGPIRSEFELTYDAWDAGKGRMVSETKRISIDAGSNLSRVESTFSSDDPAKAGPLTIGVGLAERPGENVNVPDGSPEVDSWQTSTAKGLVVQNLMEGWMAYWQPQDFNKGTTAVAIVLPKGSVETFTKDLTNLRASALAASTHTVTEGQPAVRDLLAVTRAEVGKPFVYYLGACWDRSGDFNNAAAWNKYVSRFAERRDAPLQVTIGD